MQFDHRLFAAVHTKGENMKKLIAIAVAAMFTLGTLPAMAAEDYSSGQSTVTKAKKKTKRAAKKTKRKAKSATRRTADAMGVDRSDAQRQGRN